MRRLDKVNLSTVIILGAFIVSLIIYNILAAKLGTSAILTSIFFVLSMLLFLALIVFLVLLVVKLIRKK